MFSKTISQKSGRLLTQACLFAAVAAALQLFTIIGLGQSTFGQFVGTVKDPSGAVIPVVMVSVKNLGTSATRTATGDETGSYTVVNLEPGDYEITMEAAGFQKVTRTNLQLLARQIVRVDGVMALSSQAQTVEVSVEAVAPIATEVSNISETKLGRELIDLPIALGSRATGSTSAFATLTTQPGVQIDNDGQISVAGANRDMLSITVDGISTMSARNSAPITELFPSFDGIAEIRVSEVNNTAEFGGISDVTTISKSGTNQFHGGIFENHQNSAFAARNPFSSKVPKLIMNDFGAFGGGPILKDRTFFFADYEGLRLPRQQVLTENVPSLALRNGDLSAYPSQIRDVDGTPFPGNRIPASRISLLSAAILKYLFPLPTPNAAPPNAIANNYVENFPTPISSNQGDVRVDHNIAAGHTVFGRFTYKRREDTRLPCDCTDPTNLNGTAPLGGFQRPENEWSLTGAHNWVVNPRILNEFRAGWTGFHLDRKHSILGSQIEDQLGLTPTLSRAVSSWNEKPSLPTF